MKFRKKFGSYRQGPHDGDGGQPFTSSEGDGGGGGRRGGGFNFGNIISGIGAGAAGNAIMNLLRNRDGRGAARAGGGLPPEQGKEFMDGQRGIIPPLTMS